mgnify:CR=1 FL=1
MKTPGPNWDSQSQSLLVSLPSSKMNHVASHLNKCLGGLLGIVTSREEERQKLQKQLRSAQEQLAILQDSYPPHSSRPNSFASIASSTASETAEDLMDGLTPIPVVNLTHQSATYEMEQFTSLHSTQQSKETTSHSPLSLSHSVPHAVSHAGGGAGGGAGDKRDSVMQSSVSSDSQEGEEGFHDARTDNENSNQESNVPSLSSPPDPNESSTSESTVGESD